ncbi:MAG: hypothetical protein ACREO5_00770, partial [Candidatus Binatia bacterium]
SLLFMTLILPRLPNILRLRQVANRCRVSNLPPGQGAALLEDRSRMGLLVAIDKDILAVIASLLETPGEY